MREQDLVLSEFARRILASVGELCPFGVAIAVAPRGAFVLQNDAAAELLPHLRGDPERHPITRCLAGAEVDEELAHVRADGRPLTLQVHARPVHDATGAVIAAVMTVADVTEARRRARAQELLDDADRVLFESLAVARTLQLSAELAISRLGDWCVIVTVEGDDALHLGALAHGDPATLARAREFGDAATFPLEARVWETIRSGEPALLLTIRDDQVRAGAQSPEHLEFLRGLGLRSAIVLPLIARGRALGAVRLFNAESGRIHDSLDLEVARRFADRIALAVDNARLYETAQRAGQAREDVLTVVSHDLRNPLSAITLGASVLVRKIRDADENLAVIQRSAERMERLVENLLDLASTQAGQPVAMEREVADVADVVNEAVLLQQPLAAKKSVKLVTDLKLTGASLFCDRTRIVQVIGNLLDNAIKFSSADQDVTVSGEVDGRQVQISVCDHGPGIHESDLTHVFEPYWSTPRGGKKGVGLGLSIARSIIDAHEGRMWVTSDPEKGTTFTFTLPLAETTE